MLPGQGQYVDRYIVERHVEREARQLLRFRRGGGNRGVGWDHDIHEAGSEVLRFEPDEIMMSSKGACCCAPNVSRSPLVPWPQRRRIVILNANAGSKHIDTRMSSTGMR